MGRRSRAQIQKTTQIQPQASGSQAWTWFALLAICIAVAVIRIRLLQMPLERDEGEFAYMGRLMLQGIPPYELAYNMKLPGIYAAYALIMALFGQNAAGIHFGFMLVNLAAIVVIFFLAKRVFDPVAGIAAAATYAVMSMNPAILPTSAHATHFVVLPALGGLLLVLRWKESGHWWKLLVGGLLLGTAFLMKQPGAVFGLFAVLYVLWTGLTRRPIPWRRLLIEEAALILGIALPFALTCIALWRAGVFDKFWFWTFNYGRVYASTVPFSLGMHELATEGTAAASNILWILILAGFGLGAAAWNKKARTNLPFTAGFLIFSFLGVCPGLYFRPHYWVLLLPAVALLAGVAVSCSRALLIERNAPRQASAIPIFALVIVCCISLTSMSDLLFHTDAITLSRTMYAPNPFAESVEISKYIKAHSKKDDKILVFGSEPEIYFYTGLRSATGVIYTYPLMEDQKYAVRMQRDMIAEVERARPEFIVLVRVDVSWLQQDKSPKLLLKWINKYMRDYQPVGLADMVSRFQTDYYWGDEARTQSPNSREFLYILRRSETKPKLQQGPP